MLKRRLAWGVWLLAAFVLWFFENNGGTRAVLLLSLLLPLLSLLCAVLLSRCVTCVLRAPASAAASEPVSCHCVLSGLRGWKAWLPAAISVRVESRNLWTGETETLQVPLRASESPSFTLCSTHGGRIILRLENLVFQDVFGLFRLTRPASSEASVLILPNLYPVSVLPAEETMISDAEAWSASSAPSAPPLSGETGGNELRTYLPGDPVRQIHWKLSSKLDQLLLRLPEEPPEGEPILLLDSFGATSVDASLKDALLRAFLSLSCALAHQGLPHLVSWFDPGAGNWQTLSVSHFSSFALMRESLLTTAAFWSEPGEALPPVPVSPEDVHRLFVFSSGLDSLLLGQFPAVPRALVLPRTLPDLPAGSGIPVISLSPENAVFSL